MSIPQSEQWPTVSALNTTTNTIQKKQEDLPADNLIQENNAPTPKPIPIDSIQMPPPPCSASQLQAIHTMIPDKETLRFLTNCPDNTWTQSILPQGSNTNITATATSTSTSTSTTWSPLLDQVPPSQRTTPPLEIMVGCNKGFDAVDQLRKLSLNETFDKKVWKQTMGNFDAGPCNQVYSDPYSIPSFVTPNQVRSNALVYCIEAMPSTFAKLQRSVHELQWHESLILRHLAMGDVEKDSILFPNTRVGTEDLGMKDCLVVAGDDKKKKNPSKKHLCENVTLTTLDAFLERERSFILSKRTAEQDTASSSSNQRFVIDYLSIDVEGNDWPVLLGSLEKTLPFVQYLEFEYHKVGRWQDYSLSTVIHLLREMDFICYWAGREGKLWRITDCWIPDDEWKQWSNIACVPWTRAPNLAKRMEQVFLQTIQ